MAKRNNIFFVQKNEVVRLILNQIKGATSFLQKNYSYVIVNFLTTL